MSKKCFPIALPETAKFKKENNEAKRCHAIKKREWPRIFHEFFNCLLISTMNLVILRFSVKQRGLVCQLFLLLDKKQKSRDC